MKFLWDRNQPKPTLSTIQTATSEAEEEPTQVPVEGEERNTGLVSSQERNPETSHHKSPTPKSKKPKTSDDQRLDKAFELLMATANQVNDENHHFGNLVASKLRSWRSTYNPSSRLPVQLQPVSHLFSLVSES
ncbi:uncharacterized protein LOC143037597 isoform X2 [Oratosquilla oratoria]|uniref:uncharacterized protein LOC143037597 isoform X2 n=1 Tax=Oratosquilla oratoria TaxID=337810 RepID=UPI003F774F38